MNRLSHRYSFVLAVFLSGIFLSGCGTGITIQTGQSDEEATQSSERRATSMRTDWIRQFDSMSPFDKVVMTVGFIDSVNATYGRSADQVAEYWRQGNRDKGSPISDSDVRKMTKASFQKDIAQLDSYEDIMEYALDRISRGYDFDENLTDLLEKKIDIATSLRSHVIYPNGTVSDYEFRKESLIQDGELLSRKLLAELQKYR